MELGEMLPIWSIIPFVGMLLSIAIMPMVKAEWWEKHQLAVAVFWSLVFLVPFVIAYGWEITAEELAESVVGDYIPFLVLLFGLFTVSGGIYIKGSIAGTTKNNVLLLLIGTILSSWIGTTGSAMLLIRPVLRANSWRKHRVHIVVFFIFLVANMGGCLTPLGDPPLFLGYLRGVPFFWTMKHIWPLLVLNTAILLVVFALIDRHYMKLEGEEGQKALALQQDPDNKTPIKLVGWHNVFFLGLIICAVILNGLIPQMDMFVDAATGETYGFDVFGTHVGVDYIVQIVLILLAAGLSLATTPKEAHEGNDFEWGPILEIAKLFIGIFITMIPALALLRAYGGSLGIDTPVKFFWITGLLSSFLDNSPTYVVFLTTAGSLGTEAANAVATTVGSVDPNILLAISAGAVFMGAMTYIGNAPNFMSRNIAEKNGIKMPSFFGYMAWSVCILVPLFIVDSLIFFV